MLNPPKHHRSAFTLLELLIVVAILAIIAGGVIFAINNTTDQVAEDLSRTEMLEIKQAILRFKQDTGWLPKQGPFDLQSRGGRVATLPTFVNPSLDEEWFDSPANFWQLFVCPLPPNDPLATWNPSTKRGWNGPYLSGHDYAIDGKDLAVNHLGVYQTDGTTDLMDNYVIEGAYAIGDRFHALPQSTGFYWHKIDTTTPPPLKPYEKSPGDWYKHGTPYMLFGSGDSLRLIGLGANGNYESGFDEMSGEDFVGGDDIRVYILK